MRALIIEDESRAAKRLEGLLLKSDRRINIIDKLESVEESIEYLSGDHKIDLIFSDIQLSDGLCFEIYNKINVSCPIIFTTAFDQYAINAFDTNGIGYLLKPINENDLNKALEKTKHFFANDTLLSLQKLTQALEVNNNIHYKERFIIKVGEKIRSISVHDISAFYSFEKSSYLLTNEGRKYIIDIPLGSLITKLDPKQFCQINRKYILAFPTCKEIIVYSNSRLRVLVKHLENEYIIVARERVGDFKKWLDR